jgi:hypothetical protein
MRKLDESKIQTLTKFAELSNPIITPNNNDCENDPNDKYVSKNIPENTFGTGLRHIINYIKKIYISSGTRFSI